MPLVVHLGVSAFGEPGAAREEWARRSLGLDSVDLAVDRPAGRAAQALLQVLGQIAQPRVDDAQAPELREAFRHRPQAGPGRRLAAHQPAQPRASAL